MLKRSLLAVACLILSSLSVNALAQNNMSTEAMKRMKPVEDSLVALADSMLTAFFPDERPRFCEKFVKQLVRALKVENSYYYPFDKLKTKINIISPDDDAFRVFNWIIAPSESQLRYYGAIQMPSEQLKLYGLVDISKEMNKGAEDSILTDGRWFGALYYKILANERKGEKIYTLFGLNASSPVSNKKVLDPLTFTEDGAVFGANIFNITTAANYSGHRQNRFIIEYKKEVQASLNWDNDMKMIYFDKLISQVNDPNRKYTYVPSGQYDGFRWDNSQWNYIEDLIPVQNFKDGEAPAPKPLKGRD